MSFKKYIYLKKNMNFFARQNLIEPRGSVNMFRESNLHLRAAKGAAERPKKQLVTQHKHGSSLKIPKT